MHRSANDWKLQITMRRSFDLVGLVEGISKEVADIIRGLIDIKGTVTFSISVDNNRIGILLDVAGDIKILPSLGLPEIQGELGILLSVSYNGQVNT